MARPPFIKSLRLIDFRSYAKLDVLFDGRPVVLYGKNGAGKTNLLEAISLLSPGRGMRRAKLIDLSRKITQPNDPTSPLKHWGITARLGTDNLEDDDIKLSTGQSPEAPTRRKLRIDGTPANSRDMAELLTINWLSPAQDKLFTGPASDRRKFLDRLCLAHFADHGRISLAYERARMERGRLLNDGPQDRVWYEALEKDLANHGAHIARARVNTVNALEHELADSLSPAFPTSSLTLEGETEHLVHEGQSHDDITHSLRTMLAENRAQDLRAGRTLRGVHKTDLQLRHTLKNMPASDCSTGEQKALLIGLVLAHAHAQKNGVHTPEDGSKKHISHPPILLLDEVAAHLDETRRAALIEELLGLGGHVFMSGTDAHLFEAFKGRAQVFHVQDGTLEVQ